MTLLPKIKLKSIVSFPATILDGIGVDVVKQNGSYQFNLAYDDFAPPFSGTSLPDAAHLTSLLWNSTTNSYVLTPISVLGGQGGVASPRMDGAVDPGTALALSHEDHRHPTDTTLVSKSANLSDLVDVTTSRKNLYAAPFDAMAYNGMQINGSMEVSQELGTAGRTTNGYVCDGWTAASGGTMAITRLQAAIGLANPGFLNCIVINTTTAQSSLAAGDFAVVQQPIEGYRIARLGWGTSNAQSITVGFWTAHHRSGVWGGRASNATNRTYAFTYTQAAADVWQYNTVTIPGDVAGTWVVNNTAGLILTFALAAGTTYVAPSVNTWVAGDFLTAPGQVNGVAATSDVFRITGVVVLPGIEAPSAARSPLIMRPFDQELVTCMRYWEKTYNYEVALGNTNEDGIFEGHVITGVPNAGSVNLPGNVFSARKRAMPIITLYSRVGVAGKVENASTGTDQSATALSPAQRSFRGLTNNSGGTWNAGDLLRFHWTADARL